MKNLKFKIKLLLMIVTTGICSNINAEIIPICTDINKQYLPASAKSMKEGIEEGTLVSWVDNRNNGSLYIQKLNSTGNIAWTKKGIVLDTQLGTGFTADTDYPLIFSDNSGGAVIIYRKVFFSSEEIYLQKIYPDGNHLQYPICLSSHYGGFNYSPSAALTKDNSIVVTWENFSGGDFNIHAQKINFDGAKLWNNGIEVQVCDHLFDQRKPTIVINENNYAVFTWLDERNSSNNNEYEFDLYGNRLDSDGNYTNFNSKGKLIFSNDNKRENLKNENYYLDRNNSINDIRKIYFFNHNMTASDKNNFIVAIEKRIGEEDSFIKVIKVDDNLNIVWSNNINAESFQTNPLIVSDNYYGACVFWNDKRNNESAIYGIRLDNNGRHVWGNKTGMKVSYDEMKNSAKRILPSDKNQNGIFSEYGKVYLSWTTSGVNKLFLSQLNLVNESGKCAKAVEIQDNVNDGEFTSVTTKEGKIIVVYVQSEDIFASINQISEGDNANEKTDVIESHNFPNPFNPLTTINFKINNDGFVKLVIYDMIGKEIITVVNEFKPAGNHNVKFNAQELPSGVYFYKIVTNGYTLTKRMTLIK